MNKLISVVIVALTLFCPVRASADPCERKCFQFDFAMPLWKGDPVDGADEFRPYNAFDNLWIYIGTGWGNVVNENADFDVRNYTGGGPRCAPIDDPGIGYVSGDPGAWITIVGARCRCGIGPGGGLDQLL